MKKNKEKKKAEKQKKRNNRPSLFFLLNPTNLQKEVHKYGYNFSKRNHVTMLTCLLMGCLGVGVVFKLQAKYIVLLMLFLLFMLPFLVLDMYKRMYEQKRFHEVGQYIEQMLISFKINNKILDSLKATSAFFEKEKGVMYDKIKAAIAYIEEGVVQDEDKGFMREALEIIEDAYNCGHLHEVNEFFLSVEENGGEIGSSIDILMKKNTLWSRRGYELQNQKKLRHNGTLLCMILGAVTCLFVLYTTDWLDMRVSGIVGEMTSVFDIAAIQFTSVAYIIISVLCYKKSLSKLNEDWLKEDMLHDDKKVLRYYKLFTEYDEAKEDKKGLIFAIPFFIAAIPVYLFVNRLMSAALLGIGIFMLVQSRISLNIIKKVLDRELAFSFPSWLMEMALLLNKNNVYNSLVISKDTADAIMVPELEKLIQRIDEHPSLVSSYTDFFKDFDNQSIMEIMKIFYSISEQGDIDVQKQIDILLEQITEMQDEATVYLNKVIAEKFGFAYNIPLTVCCIKLLIDILFGGGVILSALTQLQM